MNEAWIQMGVVNSQTMKNQLTGTTNRLKEQVKEEVNEEGHWPKLGNNFHSWMFFPMNMRYLPDPPSISSAPDSFNLDLVNTLSIQTQQSFPTTSIASRKPYLSTETLHLVHELQSTLLEQHKSFRNRIKRSAKRDKKTLAPLSPYR